MVSRGIQMNSRQEKKKIKESFKRDCQQDTVSLLFCWFLIKMLFMLYQMITF